MTLESSLLIAISLFFSLCTSSQLLATSLSIGVFLIGRSAQTLQLIGQKTSGPAGVLVRIIHDIFPSLDRFSIREVVAYSKPYPEGMVATSSLYFLAYFTLLLVASVLLFRKKDLT
jgi:ABC-type transport system involved in multi-copper enzyme maturation permease subunit